jgi:hypothetical protein
MAKTSVEGQGPPWAVEPVMMMIILVALHALLMLTRVVVHGCTKGTSLTPVRPPLNFFSTHS